MAPRTRRRNSIRAPTPETVTVVTLPTDLLLGIVARSDFSTIVRCAAACKLLRQDILTQPFIQRITQQTAPCIVADTCDYGRKPLTLVHPATPAAASFCRDHLSPFMLRRMAKLLRKYTPETSHSGLVVLRSLYDMQPKSDTCVYNPMTGHCTFLSKPPDVKSISSCFRESVLLTAPDGISCSFMLLFADLYIGSMKVHTITSLSSTWETITCSSHHDWCGYRHHVVLRGGVIHWLADINDHILTYNVGRRTSALVQLPLTNNHAWRLRLATSPDGNLLKLLAMEGFKIYVSLQLPTVATRGGGGGNWSLKNIIDTEEKLGSMCPDMPKNVTVYIEGSGTRSGDVRLRQVQGKGLV